VRYDTPVSSFADILKEMRAKADLSQWQLSYKCGVSRSLLANIELGKRTPPLEKLEAIGLALGLKGPELENFVLAGHAAHTTEYMRQEIAELRAKNSLLLDLAAHRDESPPLWPPDKKLSADERLTELANLRRVNRALLDELLRMKTGKRPKMTGIDHVPEHDE
jgi:transcriptional regulator with XRE-family HTH domain